MAVCTKPCCFVHNPLFLEELDKFIIKHCNVPSNSQETIENIQRLLTKHFFNNYLSFTAKHLGLAQGFDGFTVYWLHLVIPESGLSRTQHPKAYFLKIESHISFLCLNSHLQNYKDSKLRKVAQTRLEDILEVLKTHK
jgi:hypothetical protein